MSDIDYLRNQMDQITLEMVRLFKRRTDIAREIGEVKQAMGMCVTDETRERTLREKVVLLSEELGLEEIVAVKFLNFLLNESVKVQSKDTQSHLSIFRRAKEMERQGKKIIHMEVGEPDFMPPDTVGAAMQESFERGFVRYGDAKGRTELKRALAEKTSRDYGVPIEEKNVLITPGARFSVFLAVTTLLDPEMK